MTPPWSCKSNKPHEWVTWGHLCFFFCFVIKLIFLISYEKNSIFYCCDYWTEKLKIFVSYFSFFVQSLDQASYVPNKCVKDINPGAYAVTLRLNVILQTVKSSEVNNWKVLKEPQHVANEISERSWNSCRGCSTWLQMLLSSSIRWSEEQDRFAKSGLWSRSSNMADDPQV